MADWKSLVLLGLHCLSAFSAFATDKMETDVRNGTLWSPLPFGV